MILIVMNKFCGYETYYCYRLCYQICSQFNKITKDHYQAEEETNLHPRPWDSVNQGVSGIISAAKSNCIMTSSRASRYV